MKCFKGKELQVLESGALFYIGTFDNGNGDDYGPWCRLSVIYYSSKAEAKQVLKTMNFERREYAAEVQWCNGGGGCIAADN